MPKVVARGAVSQSKDEDDGVNDSLTIYYCLCGEFVLVAQAILSNLPRRPLDNSYALRNTGEKRVIYKLNGENGKELMVRREDPNGKGGYEYQRPVHCSRCKLQVAYETLPGTKGDVTFLLAGALTDSQGKIPEDAFETPSDEPESTTTKDSGQVEPSATT